MNKYRDGTKYKKSVLLFMEKYGIQEEELSAEALMKSFQRWRKKCKEETPFIIFSWLKFALFLPYP